MKTFNDNTTLSDFNAWSGAKDTKETILNAGKEDNFDTLIDELYPEGLSETSLNDLLWFETDWLYENLEILEEDQ